MEVCIHAEYLARFTAEPCLRFRCTMAIIALVPAAEAAAFTLGCALIHSQRHHAERLTEILAVGVVMVFIGLAVVSTPNERLNTAAEVVSAADVGSFHTLAYH